MTDATPNTPPAEAALITGDADDVIAALTRGAREVGIPLVDPADVSDSTIVTVAVAAVRQRGKSDLRDGMAALHAVDDALSPTAIRIVVTVGRKTRVLPNWLLRALAEEIVYQVTVAASSGVGERRLRRIRTRLGILFLDASGLHVFRIGRMRQ